MTTFDYIVVGAGTAGCLIANRLSIDPSKKVLLLEAGPTDHYHWIHIPVGYLYCIGNTKVDWCYQTEPDKGLNDRTLRYPRGKTLGGCSSINGMIYMRGQARDYDQWATILQDPSWKWDEVLPFFKIHEDHYLGQNFWHGAKNEWASRLTPDAQSWYDYLKNKGAGHEWRVEKQRLSWKILDAFSLAAQQFGINATPDFNQGNNQGVAYFSVNQKKGWRWNTAKAFLSAEVKRRPNLTVWTEAQATQLLFENIPQPDNHHPNFTPHSKQKLRCTGLVVQHQKQLVKVSAKHEVVLTAGSIGSTQLLQLSGIGPAPLLQQYGIPLVLDLPGVGENLQDHLQIRTVFKVKNTLTLNTLANSWWGKLKIGIEYLLNRSGPMSMAPSQLGAFTKSDPTQPYANLQYHVQPLSLNAFGEPLHSFPALTASVCNLNPTSRGRVQIKSANFKDAPAISPHYLSTEQDRQVAADSLRLTRQIMQQTALSAFEPEEYKPGVQFQTDEELARLAGDIATTIFHPVGTTKMGLATDPMAVVDSRLNVHGVLGLRIADAGVMPTITSGNTNSPTLMIAEKAAFWIHQDAEQSAKRIE